MLVLVAVCDWVDPVLPLPATVFDLPDSVHAFVVL